MIGQDERMLSVRPLFVLLCCLAKAAHGAPSVSVDAEALQSAAYQCTAAF